MENLYFIIWNSILQYNIPIVKRSRTTDSVNLGNIMFSDEIRDVKKLHEGYRGRR